MSEKQAFTDLHFEPHNGYGMSIDGEPMPFGYISEPGYGKPVFELSPIFEHDTHELRALALKMAAAPDMFEALRGLLSCPDIADNDYKDEETHEAERIARAALTRATGGQS